MGGKTTGTMGVRMKRSRIKCGLTQEGLAGMLGLSASTVSRRERDEAAPT